MLGTNEAFKLRNAERSAKQAKAGLWRNYVAPASAGARLSDRFQGPVVEVVSGDCLVVLDAASGAHEHPCYSQCYIIHLRLCGLAGELRV